LVESSNFGSKAFRRGSKTKKWQIEAKPTWHLFWRINQLVWINKQCKMRAPDLEEPRVRLGTKVSSVQLKDSICFKSIQIPFLGNWTLDSPLKWAWDLIKFPYFAATLKKGIVGESRPKDTTKTGWVYG
jgi:hypothetical protein